MKYCVIDIETHDPYISRNLGAGWPYKLNISSSDYEVLGCAVKSETIYEYVTDFDKLRGIVSEYDTIVCHNASYDVGGLLAIGIDLLDKTIYDTEVMSRLVNSSLPSHALDSLAKTYNIIRKGDKYLTDAVWETGLYPWLKRELTEKTRAEKKGQEYVRVRPNEAKLEKFCKNNMKLIQEICPGAMEEYAKLDVTICDALFRKFSKEVDMKIAKKYSELCKICIDYRRRGVRVDLNRARAAVEKLKPRIEAASNKVYEIAGREFNFNSGIELPAVFDDLQITYPTTAQGNPSITSPWLLQQNHEICKAIVEARKIKKISKDFIENIIDMQKYTCPGANNYGRIYPELNLLRARTGRFSCSNPNLQQIPARDPELSAICRSIFVAEEGEKIYSLDFSSQESRLQVHYAYKLNCEGAALLQQEFMVNHRLDLHQKVAKIAGFLCEKICMECDVCKKGREQAKTINLGLSYGMGVKKLSKSLELSEEQAKILIEKYNTLTPFLSQLNKKCSDTLKKRGNIRTIGGRYSHIDPPIFEKGKKRTFEYKALNKLIQGSAADQTIEAMRIAYKEKIPVLFPIHDQLVMSGTRQQAERLKEIMETAITLEVPMVVDVDLDGGYSWQDAGH